MATQNIWAPDSTELINLQINCSSKMSIYMRNKRTQDSAAIKDGTFNESDVETILRESGTIDAISEYESQQKQEIVELRNQAKITSEQYYAAISDIEAVTSAVTWNMRYRLFNFAHEINENIATIDPPVMPTFDNTEESEGAKVPTEPIKTPDPDENENNEEKESAGDSPQTQDENITVPARGGDRTKDNNFSASNTSRNKKTTVKTATKATSSYIETYTTFSGQDMVCTFELPLPSGGSIFRVIGSVTTISYSIHQDKIPIRSIGNMDARDFVFGNRTIAGSFVFTVFDRHWAQEMMDEWEKQTGVKAHFMLGELPALNCTISFANEYGAKARLSIYGMTVVNEGQVMSSNDAYMETTMEYMATDVDYMRDIEKPTTNTSSKTGNKEIDKLSEYPQDGSVSSSARRTGELPGLGHRKDSDSTDSPENNTSQTMLKTLEGIEKIKGLCITWIARYLNAHPLENMESVKNNSFSVSDAKQILENTNVSSCLEQYRNTTKAALEQRLNNNEITKDQMERVMKETDEDVEKIKDELIKDICRKAKEAAR